MKKLQVVLMTIYIVLTITRVDCFAYRKCLGLNSKCSNHTDCCSGVCTYSYVWFSGYCREENEFWYITKTAFRTFMGVDKLELCTYNDLYSETERTNKMMFDKFGVNAAYSKLPAYTILEVTYENISIDVTVNDMGIKETDPMLHLSRQAAHMLHIKHGQVVPCKINIPLVERNTLKKMAKYCMPYVLFILLIKYFY